MMQIATRFEPAAPVKGRALAVAGLLPAVAALPLAFVPGLKTPALVLAGIAVLISGLALVRALAGRRIGRSLAAAGVSLGVAAGVAVLAVQATYAPGLPALPTLAPEGVPSAVAPQLTDVKVAVGRYGRGGVPVRITNSSPRLRSVDLTVEAVTKKGRRIATDTVSASALKPGATSTVAVFAGEPAALVPQLRAATFRLIDTASYA